MSKKLQSNVYDKLRKLEMHKHRKPIEQLAEKLRPILRGRNELLLQVQSCIYPPFLGLNKPETIGMGKMGKGPRPQSFNKVVEIGLEVQARSVSVLGIGSSIDTKEND